MDAEPLTESNVPAVIRRIVEPDHYVAVLVLSLLALLSMGFLGNGPVSNLVVTAVVGADFVYACYTSRAPRPVVVLAVVLLLVSLTLTFTASVTARGPSGYTVRFVLATLFLIVTTIVIARRLAQHPVISVQTITGALCVYVLFGLFFASMYRLLNLFGLNPFFAQTANPTPADYVYFSFVTLTTVGYGDLTTTHNLARMLAITEAMLGQFYLVTVIAVLVSRAGRERAPRRR
jgi:hypothetical protein